MRIFKFSIFAFFLLFFLCSPVFAEGIIGKDRIISVNTVSFLTSIDPEQQQYIQVFNYFFTIELLTGLLGAFVYQVIRVFRM